VEPEAGQGQVNITAAHRSRWSRFSGIGCVACRKDGRFNFNTQTHHLNLGGRAGQKRIGHDATIPLCAWHHTGLPPNGKDSKWATQFMGPSLAKSSKAFRERYGTDEELLSLTNDLLTTFDRL
jgi:hypothetical protein